ncbi:MAG TPA: hydrogenase expression/formation protein [Piscirickettsiaceae bacterium]|nr:hydrogenase expression/formation protein [Piscirickettsiaceae bacterium]
MSGQFKELGIPVSIVGPGTQPESEDGLTLDYMPMPKEMYTYEQPALYDETLDNHPGARPVLEQLQRVLTGFEWADECVEVIALTDMEKDDLRFLLRLLGEGEVSMVVRNPVRYEIQESVLAGVWLVREHLNDGSRYQIHVGALPVPVWQYTFDQAAERVRDTFDSLPDGVMNAPPILVELNEQAQKWQPGMDAHVINLTLLPQTPEDLEFLGQHLGAGPTEGFSRGYGTVRMLSTGLKNTWWVRYFNSEDKLILDTIEVTRAPKVLQAAKEDLEDSAQRLDEIMETIA